MLTAHPLCTFTGNAGPSAHSVNPAAKKSEVLLMLHDPPMRYVPTFSIVTGAAELLGWGSSPIRVSSHSWVFTSNTRHDAVSPYIVYPPHVTIFELGPVVAKVECASLPEGKAGREQPVG